MAVSTDRDDPTAKKLLDLMERRKVKAGLGVSQGATTKEQVYQELLKRHPAVVRSRQSTAKTCPQAVCAQAGSSCATHPEEQLQAGEELIVGPQTCNTQQVRWCQDTLIGQRIAFCRWLLMHVCVSGVCSCGAGITWRQDSVPELLGLL